MTGQDQQGNTPQSVEKAQTSRTEAQIPYDNPPNQAKVVKDILLQLAGVMFAFATALFGLTAVSDLESMTKPIAFYPCPWAQESYHVFSFGRQAVTSILLAGAILGFYTSANACVQYNLYDDPNSTSTESDTWKKKVRFAKKLAYPAFNMGVLFLVAGMISLAPDQYLVFCAFLVGVVLFALWGISQLIMKYGMK